MLPFPMYAFFVGIWSLTQVCRTSQILWTFETTFWDLFRPRRGRFIHPPIVGKLHGQVHFGKELKDTKYLIYV